MASPIYIKPVTPDEQDVPWQTALLFFGAAVVGGALTISVFPIWLPALRLSLFGPSPHGFWYLARTAGMVAYGLAWMSMAYGLLITNKLARVWPGGPTAFVLHEYTSLLALAFATFHAVVLLGDHYIGYTLPQLIVPFANADYRQLAVGLGQIAFYTLLVVTFSFYARKSLGPRAWRVIHALSYAVFALALLHGVLAGTDSPDVWAQWYYWLTALALIGLTAYRILARRLTAARRRGRAPLGA